jgi:ABC-2 type transport system ATP-binding protein
MNQDQQPDPIVQWAGVSKSRGKRQALSDFSLAVAPGRVLGLIGPNGAGKTTAIELLLGMLRPDAGSVRVFGQPVMGLPWPDRQRIGYLAERTRGADLPQLTVPELLSWQSCYFERWDSKWCDVLVQRLAVVTDQRVWSMSEGQRRRAEMVLALAHRPSLLVLDDPALGLDALARRDLLWTTIDAVRDEGTTVLFTSHVLQDVERIVDDICILDRGRVRLQGALDDVLARCKRLVVPAESAPAKSLPGEVKRETRGRETVVVTTAFDAALGAGLAKGGCTPRVDPMNLEDIFCSVVETPREAPAAEGAP